MLTKITFVLIFSLFILNSSFSILHSSEINLPNTGQTTSYATGDNGAILAGQPFPSPRFTDNANGTVTDNLTGLIWLRNANCLGYQTWANALDSANNLGSPACGLSDNSTAGQWRLPTRKELQSLVDASKFNPVLPAGHPFTNVQAANFYWSSTTYANYADYAWALHMTGGGVYRNVKTNSDYVWPVRGGL